VACPDRLKSKGRLAVITEIASVTDSDTLLIPSPGLSGAATAGNRVFAYTTQIIRPLYIQNAYLRDTDSQDTQILPMTQTYYENLVSKSEEGFLQYYLYENTLVNGTIRLDCAPDDVTKVLGLVFMAPIEDLDATSNDIAYPQEWLLPIALGLAKLVAPKFQKTWNQELESNFQGSLAIAQSPYPSRTIHRH